MTIGPVTITRDGALLWLLALSAAIAYLSAAATPPTQWGYHEWLQAGAAVAAWGIGKLQVSPAPSSAEVKRGFRDSGEPV